MKIAIVQHDIVWEDREANFAVLGPKIAEVAAAGARLVVLSETFSTGFSMSPSAREPFDGPSAQFLQSQAQQHNIYVAGSFPEIPVKGGLPFNTLMVAGPTGDEVYRYRKIHPFTYGGETEHFQPGSEFVTIKIDSVRVSPFICYDLRFADEFWALASHTDAYLVVANWPEVRRTHWQALIQARAIENQAYVIACNRVGEGGGLTYSGDSRVVDPLGEIVVSAARNEAILVTDIDAEQVAAVRAKFRFLQDRR